MKYFSLYIARRYTQSKKTFNAINIMSGIATAGVFVGTAALIIVLSVFNGFENLVVSLYSSFDADLQIKPVQGKTFIPSKDIITKIKAINGVVNCSDIMEENVLLRNGDKQYFASMKGMDVDIAEHSALLQHIEEGQLTLYQDSINMTSIGAGIAATLNIHPQDAISPLTVYVPNRLSQPDLLHTDNAFNIKSITVSSVFSIQQDFDSKYILVPISFARELLSYSNEVTSLEVNIKPDANFDKVQEDIKQLMGANFEVRNKGEQHALLYKIMKSEKWAVFFILVFILIVASFNVIGSLTMLIIDKKKDIAILKSMGADKQTTKRIFLFHGLLISFYGAITGIIIGFVVCFIQQKFGIIKLGSGGNFVVDAYPVKMLYQDFIYVLLTVLLIGIAAAYFAANSLNRLDEEGLAASIKNE